MADLIDRRALDLAFSMLRFNEDGTLRHWDDRQNWCLSGQEVEDLINSIPSVEPSERKTGRWVFGRLETTSGCFYGVRRCSECGMVGGGTRYCPYCGADMKGGNDETD